MNIDFSDFFDQRSFKDSLTELESPLQVGARMKESIAGIDGVEEADIILLGCHSLNADENFHAANKIRKELAKLYDWYPNYKVLDIGTLLRHRPEALTPTVLKAVLTELYEMDKVVILIGGSQDFILQQYAPFKTNKKPIEITIIDQKIDLQEKEIIDEDSYLMELLLSQENYVKHLNIVGFESYFTNPEMLETLDKLRFDCYRVGRVREDLEGMEPVFRNSDIVSIDMSVLRYSEGVFYKNPSPNGLFGDELCALAKYAGMSEKIKSFGIAGYLPELDVHNLGAKLIAQMIWYFLDGFQLGKKELTYKTKPDNFKEYHVEVKGYPLLFIQSKRTNRWWVQLLNKDFIPCSNIDYHIAASGDLPDAWLRAQERLS